MHTSIDFIVSKFSEENSVVDEMIDSSLSPSISSISKIFNFSIAQHERVEAIEDTHASFPDEFAEIISKLTSIYCMSPIGGIRRFLNEVATLPSLPTQHRLNCCIALKDIESSEKLGIDGLYTLRDQLTELPTPQQIEILLCLVESGYPDIIDKVHKICNSQTIECPYRYKLILSLKDPYSADGMCVFIQTKENELSFRILGCQYLLSKKINTELCEDILLNIMNDESLPNNLRADASDVILHLGSPEMLADAERIIRELGGGRTLYENSENVHTQSIEQSVLETIQFLDLTTSGKPLPSLETVFANVRIIAKRLYRQKTVTTEDKTTILIKDGHEFETTTTFVNETVSDVLSEEEKKVDSALLRIELDKTVFRDSNCNLASVLKRLYVHIQNSDPNVLEMEKRLVEELVEMAGTCSSGYVSRLVNVLSGFGRSLQMSWEDQIVGNFSGRLNALIRKDENMDEILSGMTADRIENRIAFLTFFRKNMLGIREEMYMEFKDHMTDTDFDLYFRKAILSYEA